MNTSTREDVLANIDTLRETAQSLMNREPQDSDWWHCVTIGDKQFDINIYDWETEDGLPLRIATAYPVVHDESGYGTTNTSCFVRLIEKKGLDDGVCREAMEYLYETVSEMAEEDGVI